MYSGTTFRHKSGNITGVHQRIDRVARKHLATRLEPSAFFPSTKDILRFEGKDGPDGIKTKSPAIDEPWHFIAPGAGPDDPLVVMITDHMYNLARALKEKNEVRAGFEAAWLAHAITDGLTPAHHYPLAEKVEELWGKPYNQRLSTRDKIVIKGTGARDTLSKNWEYWGTKGVFTAHLVYELGVSSAITTSRFKTIGLTDADFERIDRDGYTPYFLESVTAIDAMGTYQEFMKTGWSSYLASVTRRELVPLIMKNVCLAWYAATKRITQ